MFFYEYIFLFITYFLIFLFFKKNNLLKDKIIFSHKKLSYQKNSYLIGGIFIFVFLIFYFFKINNFFLIIFFSLIFVLGITSDLSLFNNPKLRLLAQSMLLTCFVIFFDLKIENSRVIFFDNYFLNNYYFNIFFTVFCLIIVINGTNFLDGINLLVSLYFLLVFGSMYFVIYETSIKDFNLVFFIIPIILFIIFFNINGLVFLGDSGSYLLSFLAGYLLIDIYYYNQFISPYFVILLLWYPCFELLFSMVRRFFNHQKSYQPDNLHLHQLFILFFEKFFNFSKQKNHFFVSLVINIYNLFIFIIAVHNYNFTKILLVLIFLNVSLYLISYSFLNTFLQRSK